MRALIARALSFIGAIVALGCGTSDYEVVRVHGGRARVGRFVSSVAYAASLEAAIAEQQGDWARAVTLLSRARDEDPDGPELQARLGVALCELGKHQAGMFALDDALRIDPYLERAWTGRARCRRKTAKSASDLAAVREDLRRALEADAEALEPKLMLIELDLAASALPSARARAEEAVILHPTSSAAWRALAQVSARQGDAKRAVAAALITAQLDDENGKKAKAEASEAIDKGGVAEWALALRGTHKPQDVIASKIEGPCGAKLEALEKIAQTSEPQAVTLAAEAVRSACPGLDARVTFLEVVAAWTPKTAAEVEERALSSASAEARRFGARMRLRHKALSELLEPDALPDAADRPTLALQLAAAAAKKPSLDLARVARDLAPDEPTVARLAAEAARKIGGSEHESFRKAACALARTEIERRNC